MQRTARRIAIIELGVWFTGASRDVRRVFITHGLKKPRVSYAPTVADALVIL